MSKIGWWMHESQLNLMHVFHLQQAYENQRHLMYVLYLTGLGKSSGLSITMSWKKKNEDFDCYNYTIQAKF